MRLHKTSEEKKAIAKAYFRARYLANREHFLKKQSEYRAANKEKVAAAVKRCLERYAKEDPTRIRDYRRQYAMVYRDRKNALERERCAKPEAKQKKSAYEKKWRKENPAQHCAKSNRRRAATMRRLPAWVSMIDGCRIKEFYEIAKARSVQTGIPHHVDHIIPLRGRSVSGLHVPSNLQVITAKENLRKQNFYC